MAGKELTEALTDRNLVASLIGTTCPACGGRKRSRNTLCAGEFYTLPRHVQRALYNPLGHGYREAVLEAMEFLEVGEFKLPATEGVTR
jgi:hypothetical protein